MNIENTAGDPNQTPPGDASTGDTANPDGKTGTDPTKPEGQGEPGDKATATDDGKVDDGKKPEDTGTVELNGAPESYESFQLPDGFVLEGDRLAMATDIAKELNLSQAGAQKLIDAYTKLATDDASGLVDKVTGSEELLAPILETAREQDKTKWGIELKTELGDQYEAQAALATTAVKAVNDPELLKEFDRLGWGNHPRLFKAFAFFGKQLRDSPTDGLGRDASSAADDGKPLANRMYPDM